mmetsp:Transcript_10158/g.22884  ORF Transcript_10158/g.22884 Transcript_10158/m.22884 type:complete len:338 (-) Transcript_10158:191-1204(-)|eukprot:CAMPEP_0178405282 /NCGR_PEP_ID=MMETSP0689_2-20121128/18319_1 /TAXON_ID=160604 /ORGANISM="Amphidinium massartii, Strain CS-259" /LENGTH=337 /DNA_ID=CAMNT_0020026293 /DNA_START=108 /DNA_END=1121 /DNA_ORIENTATION=+
MAELQTADAENRREAVATGEAFFEESKDMRPGKLSEVEAKLQDFLAKQVATKRVALVTSGGTTVPLERRTVRFIDNFSSGNRGAATVENLLRSGYSVIFLHRHGSAFPFIRKQMAAVGSSTVPSHAWWADSAAAVAAGTAGLDLDATFLPLQFQTIFEYLFLLRSCSIALRPLGCKALLLLAAAVSDFYIPASAMENDKIQSSIDGLTLRLQNVPKMLGAIRQWAPEACLVSFKLETNENILRAKAAGAMKKYNVNAVVANNLLTYKDVVHILRAATSNKEVHIEAESIQGDETAEIPVRGLEASTIRRPEDCQDIEPQLVEALCELHEAHTQRTTG